jgi:beta-lactamase regulating signal transducer with metallopeptidase domain
MLIYLIQVSAVLAVLTLMYRLLLRRESLLGLNRIMLWCNVLLAFGLPVAELPDFRPAPVKAIINPLETWAQPRIDQWRNESMAIAKAKQGTIGRPVESIRAFDWTQVFVWIYGLGVVAFIVRLLWQLMGLGRLLARSDRQKDGHCWLVKSHEISSPFSFFVWIFYNPTLHSETELAQVLTHERVHITQRHSIDMVMAECVRIVLWINPFAWWHQHLVAQNLEFLADRATLSTGIDRKSYQLNLLKSTLNIKQP